MQVIDVQGVDMAYLLSRVEEGETFVLERGGQPIARLVPEPAPKESAEVMARRRTEGFGFLKGKMVVPDDIKTPFAAEIEEMFYGNPNKFSRESSSED